MTLTTRDKAILKDLKRFRVMDRDSISELHFSDVKNKKDSTNHVLLRLLRDGHIQRSKSFVPYVYFGPNSEIKKNSAKIPHFLKILSTYKEMKNLSRQQGKILETFQVEPKYGKKGCVEPDIFCRYRGTNFFIEVQRTVYSEKQMQEKLNRYVDFYNSGVMANPFPRILILTDTIYALGDYPFKVFQAESFTAYCDSFKPDQPAIKINSETNLKLKIN